MPTRRNPVAHTPILRKGGVHQRARSGERQAERELLHDLLREGLEEYQENTQQQVDPGEGNTVLPDPYYLLSHHYRPLLFIH